jgi:transcriptional regulator with XRE-family HTH domain
MSSGHELTESQQTAAESLALGKTQRQAATIAGVDQRTILRWTKDPTFRETVADLRRFAYSVALNRLASAGHDAAATVLEVMREKKNHPAVRLQAAKIVLEHLHSAISVDETNRRIEEIEARQFALDGGRG